MKHYSNQLFSKEFNQELTVKIEEQGETQQKQDNENCSIQKISIQKENDSEIQNKDYQIQSQYEDYFTNRKVLLAILTLAITIFFVIVAWSQFFHKESNKKYPDKYQINDNRKPQNYQNSNELADDIQDYDEEEKKQTWYNLKQMNENQNSINKQEDIQIDKQDKQNQDEFQYAKKGCFQYKTCDTFCNYTKSILFSYQTLSEDAKFNTIHTKYFNSSKWNGKKPVDYIPEKIKHSDECIFH